jgi:hypothetical protein
MKKIVNKKLIIIVFFSVFTLLSKSNAQWSENATSIWNTTLSKNVGIGVISPQVKLQVRGDVIVGSPVLGQRFLFHTRDWAGGDAFHIAPDDNSGNWLFDKGITLLRSSGNFGINITPIQTLDVNGRINVRNGVIQNGTTPITTTNDLGLYSQLNYNWMRLVTTNGPIRFFTDGGIGTTPVMTIEANGDIGVSTTAINYAKLKIENREIKRGLFVINSNRDNNWPAVWGDAKYTDGIGVFGIGDLGVAGIQNFSTSSSHAGFFQGNLYCYSLTIASDKRFKKDIKPLSDGVLSRLMNINVSEYYYDSEHYPTFSNDKRKKIGVIAQELEKVFPELVNPNTKMLDPTAILTDDKSPELVGGYYSVDYVSMIPLLIKAIQEQQSQINSLCGGNISSQDNAGLSGVVEIQNKIISEQELRIKNIEDALIKLGINLNNSSGPREKINENIEDNVKKEFRSDSYPNPFNPKTTIRFSLPSAMNVSLKVYDITGRLVSTLINNEYRSSGEYKVEFDGSAISSGTYFYTIEAGIFNETKKIILTK